MLLPSDFFELLPLDLLDFPVAFEAAAFVVLEPEVDLARVDFAPLAAGFFAGGFLVDADRFF